MPDMSAIREALHYAREAIVKTDCPRPINGHEMAVDCVNAGECGCCYYVLNKIQEAERELDQQTRMADYSFEEDVGTVTIEMVRTIKRLLPALVDTPNLSVADAVSKAIIEHHTDARRQALAESEET